MTIAPATHAQPHQTRPRIVQDQCVFETLLSRDRPPCAAIRDHRNGDLKEAVQQWRALKLEGIESDWQFEAETRSPEILVQTLQLLSPWLRPAPGNRPFPQPIRFPRIHP